MVKLVLRVYTSHYEEKVRAMIVNLNKGSKGKKIMYKALNIFQSLTLACKLPKVAKF